MRVIASERRAAQNKIIISCHQSCSSSSNSSDENTAQRQVAIKNFLVINVFTPSRSRKPVSLSLFSVNAQEKANLDAQARESNIVIVSSSPRERKLLARFYIANN